MVTDGLGADVHTQRETPYLSVCHGHYETRCAVTATVVTCVSVCPSVYVCVCLCVCDCQLVSRLTSLQPAVLHSYAQLLLATHNAPVCRRCGGTEYSNCFCWWYVDVCVCLCVCVCVCGLVLCVVSNQLNCEWQWQTLTVVNHVNKELVGCDGDSCRWALIRSSYVSQADRLISSAHGPQFSTDNFVKFCGPFQEILQLAAEKLSKFLQLTAASHWWVNCDVCCWVIEAWRCANLNNSKIIIFFYRKKNQKSVLWNVVSIPVARLLLHYLFLCIIIIYYN